MSLSNPCRERCPTCGGPCFGSHGHTTGQRPELHQCRAHVWGTITEYLANQRYVAMETRREFEEARQERWGRGRRYPLTTGG